MALVRISHIKLQHKRTATISLCRLMQNSSMALVQERYFHKRNFYLGNLVDLVFATFSIHVMDDFKRVVFFFAALHKNLKQEALFCSYRLLILVLLVENPVNCRSTTLDFSTLVN